MEEIFAQVEKETGVTKDQLVSKSRVKKLSDARLRFINLALDKAIHPKEIGRLLNRDRTTILYYIKPKKIEA